MIDKRAFLVSQYSGVQIPKTFGIQIMPIRRFQLNLQLIVQD